MILRWATILAVISLVAVAGCDGSREPGTGGRDSGTAAPDSRRPDPDSRPAIVFLGTSLTAGYGLDDPSQAYPALIQAKLDSAGRPYHVVNAGISGESSAGALARVDWLLRQNPAAVLVIETGANDGLRGQDPDSVRGRIQGIIDRAMRQEPPPRIVLAGMEALPNLGAAYARRFRAIYPALARSNDVTLVPFLLAGVAGVDSLNQDDGIHPTREGQRIVAEHVWKAIEQVTRR
jgi:acyl-CoA thioesterase I